MTLPNTIFSVCTYRIKVSFRQNCLKIFSEQKQKKKKKKSGHYRLEIIDQMSFSLLMMLVWSSRSFIVEKKQSAPKLRFLHRKSYSIEFVVSNR